MLIRTHGSVLTLFKKRTKQKFITKQVNMIILLYLDCLQANHGGLKQKSDIEHYRNKLRQKARRKGYGEFSLSETGSHGYSHHETRHSRHDNGVKEPMTAEEKRASFAGCHKRYGEDI